MVVQDIGCRPALLITLLVSCGPPGRPAFSQLEAAGDPIVEQIERHRAAHGTYPSDLDEAGIALPDAPYGGWKYQSYEGGEDFQLSIGDYIQHDFTLFWTGNSASWYRDT